MNIEFLVSRESEGMRLDLFLRKEAGFSSNQLRHMKRNDLWPAVDGRPMFLNQPIHSGQVISVCLPDYEPLNRPLSNLPAVKILYEDPYLLAVWKPPFLQTHPSSSASWLDDTLEARVCEQLGNPAHPVHRLDCETSGIVLFSKLPYVQWLLQRELQADSFQKEYLAVVLGCPIPHTGEIDAPIARETSTSFTRHVSPNGQQALTRYRLMETHLLPGNNTASILSLWPLTGRTHQLRVHLSYIGYPILGDERYNMPESRFLSLRLGLHRQQLCACKLRFQHPISQKSICLEAAPDLEILHLFAD